MIGVHAAEFAFEKDPENVRKAVRNLGISYPVALDDNLAMWRAFQNHYWPAHYFIDGKFGVLAFRRPPLPLDNVNHRRPR